MENFFLDIKKKKIPLLKPDNNVRNNEKIIDQTPNHQHFVCIHSFIMFDHSFQMGYYFRWGFISIFIKLNSLDK